MHLDGLALQFHSDRGGENEQFIKIKQAYEDLKIGKKYPETDIEKIKNSKVYSSDNEDDVRRKKSDLRSANIQRNENC